MINYSNPINVGDNPGYLVRTDTVGQGLVYYVLHGPSLTEGVVSPFNEYGVCYSESDIQEGSLDGVFTTSTVANVPGRTEDITYLVKDSDGFYVTSNLDSVRDGYGITAVAPQGILKVAMNADDGIWIGISMGTQMLDVSQVLNNTFVT